ncbi:MAG: 2-hydroxy-3-oxopropionate reductase [Acidimicrobiaceae bacterium]|nr:2-hydroxy-3-oxopropionate reductase [Acidimicrobiaceae bacterium]
MAPGGQQCQRSQRRRDLRWVAMKEPIGIVGFIGLGVMGAPMAANLVRAGFDVVGFNRSARPYEALVLAGGRVVDTVEEVTHEADAIITMLPDGPAVEGVLLGRSGVLASSEPDLLYVDMSTIDLATTRRVAQAAEDWGVHVLDAPVSGGEIGAIEASLSVMVGGDTEDFAAALPLFEAVGKTIAHVGPSGAGQIVKAANQLIVGGTIALVAEAIVFLETYDIDTESAIRVLSGGLAGNRILDRKAAGMLARDFHPGFRVDLHHKDMGILLDAARDAGVCLPVGALIGQMFTAVRAHGDGALDHTALLRLVEMLSGRDPQEEAATA